MHHACGLASKLAEHVAEQVRLQPPPTRRENLNRMRGLAQAVSTLILNTGVDVIDADYCAACEVSYPFLDPAVLVRRSRDAHVACGRGLARRPLRGMCLEVEAAAALAPRCADRLHDLYFEPSRVVQLEDYVIAATMFCNHQRRPGSALAMLRRYGKFAAKSFKNTQCLCGTDIAEEEWPAIFDTGAMPNMCVKCTLEHSVKNHPGFFLGCVGRVRDANADVTKPSVAKLLVAMYANTLKYAQLAIDACNWDVLGAIAESPAFGHDKSTVSTPLSVWLSKRAAMLLVIGSAKHSTADQYAEELVGALITDDVSTENVYVCAAECAAMGCANVARRLIEILRARGGVTNVSQYGRTMAFRSLRCASAHGLRPVLRSDRLAIERDILEQLKVALTNEEASRLEHARKALLAPNVNDVDDEGEDEEEMKRMRRRSRRR